jgi:DNA-binding Lrp family transcriptional regulator
MVYVFVPKVKLESKMAQQLDKIDQQLIGLLRQNARAPVAFLSKKLGVSRATVQNRMARLEKSKTITGYSIIVNSSTNDSLSAVRAMMSIELEGNVFQSVSRRIKQEPAIIAIHSTNGRWDMVIEIKAGSLSDFDAVLKRVRSIDGIANSETNIFLNSETFSF